MGQVPSHDATSIEIAFDLSHVRAGQTSTFVLEVQMTEAGGQGCIMKSGTFVQITVTQDDPPTGQDDAATDL